MAYSISPGAPAVALKGFDTGGVRPGADADPRGAGLRPARAGRQGWFCQRLPPGFNSCFCRWVAVATLLGRLAGGPPPSSRSSRIGKAWPVSSAAAHRGACPRVATGDQRCDLRRRRKQDAGFLRVGTGDAAFGAGPRAVCCVAFLGPWRGYWLRKSALQPIPIQPQQTRQGYAEGPLFCENQPALRAPPSASPGRRAGPSKALHRLHHASFRCHRPAVQQPCSRP